MKHKHFLLFSWLLLCGWPALASGETLYVTDKLFLGLYPNSDGSGQQMKVIPSGTALEVLERKGRYARVSTPEGETGWVKGNYLVADLPAVVRILEVEDELQKVRDASGNADSIVALNKSLERELNILSKELTRALAEVDELSAKLSTTEEERQQAVTETRAANKAMSAMAATLQQVENSATVNHEVAASEAEPDAGSSTANPHSSLQDAIGDNINRGALLALAALGLIVVGFFIGYKYLENHIRRQHGGYRVW